MTVQYLKSKLHNAVITQAELEYEGSISIDAELMAAAGLLANEKVSVFNFDNGNRFETYVIRGEPGSRTIGLNGPAALLGKVGQRIIVVSYAFMTPKEAETHQPDIVILDGKSNIISTKK